MSLRALMLLVGLVMTLGEHAVIAQSMATQAEMHARVVSLYSFAPHTLTDAGRQAKSDEMDKFWSDVKAAPDKELPMLRIELGNNANPEFFMADGGQLLLSLSKTQNDMQLVAETLPRVDLADIQSRTYFYTVHDLSMAGVDTTQAALHILDDEKFAVIVPQHAMTLDQHECLMYMLLPVREELWIKTAEERLLTEKSVMAQKSLILLFVYAQAHESDLALRAAAKNMALPEEVRKMAQDNVDTEVKTSKKYLPVKGNEASVREQRRVRFGYVSDEAMDDTQWMTEKLMMLRKKEISAE